MKVCEVVLLTSLFIYLKRKHASNSLTAHSWTWPGSIDADKKNEIKKLFEKNLNTLKKQTLKYIYKNIMINKKKKLMIFILLITLKTLGQIFI